MNKALKLILTIALAIGFFALLRAETVEIDGVEVTYAGATVKQVDGDTLLVFTNVNVEGSFSIPASKTAKAHLLLVGGGGAGGTVGQDIPRGAAGGGGAGGVSDRNVMLEAGSYTVIVGAGGVKAQTSVQSWVGDDGESSAIRFGDEGYVASTKGGGGGGSVKIGGEGSPGASGGGGTWYGAFLAGGSGTEGYGWAGGTPTDETVGGGGGGASSISTEGAGGPDGRAGAGRTSDITGEIVEYARGGRGGRRGDGSYTPGDGAVYGAGGDGAVNGFGGKGADGIVIVRISKVFEYKFVDYPAPPVFTNTFAWVDGESYVAFDLSRASDEFKAALLSVEGVTNTTCSITGGGATTNGLGRFKFTLYLNDEYKWNDGTAQGSPNPHVCSWRVKEPDVVGEVSVEISKTVDWFKGTNATIAIDVHSTPEVRKAVPNILMIGSLCSSHGFSAEVLQAAINAVTEVGNIDYYFFKQSAKLNHAAEMSGSLTKGQTYSGTPSMDRGQHGTLYGFYNTISKVIDDGKEYDYIIMSFDRGLVGVNTTAGAHPDERKVAEYLKPFYQSGSVIWLVDSDPSPDDDTHGVTQTPWYPGNLVFYLNSRVTPNARQWHSYYYYYNVEKQKDATTAQTYARNTWRAMMGMFDPLNYDNCTDSLFNANYNISDNDSSDTKSKIANLSGSTNPNQVVYDNAQNVADLIGSIIRPVVATLQLEDHVYLENGLKIDSTEGYWTTNAAQKADGWETAQTDWMRLTPDELTNSDTEGVRISIPGVTSEVWLKLKVGVFDTGRFLSSVDATYNERTGQWEKDPNNGPVSVQMTSESGDAVLAEDKAITTVEWSFEAFKITGGVVSGDGDFIINGFFTNLISVAKGYNPEVLFRGAPGWAVNYIEVDGVVLDEVNYQTNWFFGAISADHDIRVGFTNIVVTPPPPEIGPTEAVYDGTGYAPVTTVPPTFAEGYEEYSNRWYMVYSTDPDADPNDRSAWSRDGVVTNVVVDADGVPQPQTVYARICIEQPGYEDGAVVDYWIGTNTVTILPREIEVTFDDYVQTSDTRKANGFPYTVTAGEIIEGDELALNDGKCTNYPDKGQTKEDVITNAGDFYVTSANGTTHDYVITVVPGDYIYPDLDIVAQAPDIVKYYDALATGTVATVVFPVGAATHVGTSTATDSGTYTYSSGDNTTGVRNGHVSTHSGYNPGAITYYYNCVSNWTDTITTTCNCVLTIEYSDDGGVHWSDAVPEFTDAGEYEVMYRVSYTSNVVISATRTAWLTGRTDNNWGTSVSEISNSRKTMTLPSQTVGITYTTASGTATITILPRKVTVGAGSAEKVFNGAPLTQSAYTKETADVAAGDQSGEGFIEGEGFASVTMTAGSTITLPGSVANTIDEGAVALKSNTKAGNYEFRYQPGTLVVTPNAITATSTAADQVYNGNPNTSFEVTGVKDADGNPLDPSQYTIKYKRYPWEDYTLDAPPANDKDSGEYVVFYQVTGKDGYTTYEGYQVYHVTQRTVTLIADGATKFYDGDPLATNAFTVAEASDPVTEGFAAGEGVSALVMTSSSTITEPGEQSNVIDPNAISNWVFTGGLDEATFRRNYVYTLVPSNLEVKVQARALWIVDHENPGDGHVYLAFEPELLDASEGVDWIRSFSSRGKFKVKYGRTRAEADACRPVPAVLSDHHVSAADKVWLKVSLKDLDEVSVVEPEGFWRIMIDGPARHLTDAEEDFGYDKTGGGASLQSAAPGVPGGDVGVLGTNGAVSVNTFGILKIAVPTTNTLVAVPWTWYSKIQRNAEDIPVCKLVKTTNLSDGDILYAYVDDFIYSAWIVEHGDWTPVDTVLVDGKPQQMGGEQIVYTHDAEGAEMAQQTRIARGSGLWLVRRHPLDQDNNPLPFWVYGQSVTTAVETVIASTNDQRIAKYGRGEVSTILGNPYAEATRINDLQFEGEINPNDTIMVPNSKNEMIQLRYLRKNGKAAWYYSYTQKPEGERFKKTYYDDSITVPAGLAFWYVRRDGTTLTLKWPRSE